jgi:hypothetical protein
MRRSGLAAAAAFAGVMLAMPPAIAQPSPDWRRGPAERHLVPANPTTSPGRIVRCNPPVMDTNRAPRGKVCGNWKTEQRITQRSGLGLSAQCFLTIRTCTAFIDRRIAR